MARRKKQQKLLKKILVIGGSLLAVQVALVVYFSQSGPSKSMKEEISDQIATIPGLTPDRRERMRIQLAVDDYRAKRGKLPKGLQELVPDYFDAVPKDASTGKPYVYTVEGKRFLIGEGSRTSSPVLVSSSEGGPPTVEEQEYLIASLATQVDETTFVFDPTGKRDPFEPIDLSKRANEDCKNAPLTCFDLGQLRYSTFLQMGDEPRAMVEDASGVGHMVRIGSKVGRNDGEIAEILSDKISVVETLVNVTGQTSTRVVPLPLRPKLESPSQGRRGQTRSRTR